MQRFGSMYMSLYNVYRYFLTNELMQTMSSKELMQIQEKMQKAIQEFQTVWKNPNTQKKINTFLVSPTESRTLEIRLGSSPKRKIKLVFDAEKAIIQCGKEDMYIQSRQQVRLLELLFSLNIGESIKTEEIEMDLYDNDVNNPQGALKQLIYRINEKTNDVFGIKAFSYRTTNITRIY